MMFIEISMARINIARHSGGYHSHRDKRRDVISSSSQLCVVWQVNGNATQSVSFYPNGRLLDLGDSVIWQLGKRDPPPAPSRVHTRRTHNRLDRASLFAGDIFNRQKRQALDFARDKLVRNSTRRSIAWSNSRAIHTKCV